MAYCTNCGLALSEEVNFCPACGTPVEVADEDAIDAEEFFADDEDVEDEEDEEDLDDEVEDGDEELEGKDLDPNRGYYMTVDGRNATMYMDNGQIIRRFHMHANVIQATTSGQTVTILTDDGYTALYSWTGQLIRRTKHR